MEQTSLLSQSVWLELPLETRAKLATLFEMPEKGSVQTMYGPTGPTVISDGYSYDHLKRITLEKMNEFLGTDSNNFYATFRNLVKHLDDIIGGEKIVIEEIIVEEMKEAFEEGFVLGATEGVRVIQEAKDKNKFCEFCDSKGVRHLKICTRPIKEHETETTETT